MKTQLVTGGKQYWVALKHFYQQGRGVFVAACGVASFTILLRASGLLQSLEWAAYDQMFRWRPSEPVDERILIVGIDETDLNQIQQWPIPDAVLAELLQKLNAYSPRAIGLDLYRDLPVPPGHAELQEAFATIPNLVGIEEFTMQSSTGVPAPKVLADRNAVGFNNVMLDSDGKVRRNLLYLWHNGKSSKSFGLSLALLYLKEEGISQQQVAGQSNSFRLGSQIFSPFQPNDGPYIRADNGGYQILANFHASGTDLKGIVPYRRVSMRQVLENRVPPEWVRDRVVAIGSTATSIKDFFYTPNSGQLMRSPHKVFGVELHANFISQILSAALDERPPSIATWPEPVEWLWILGWSLAGATISWFWRSPRYLIVGMFFATATLVGFSTFLFFTGCWVPLIPSLVTLIGSATAIATYIAYQEEQLKRAFAESKEFLHQIINTIPDPIFVKDKNHRCVVLNEAYCQFIGYPLDVLLEKSDSEIFPAQEADIFWQEDERVLSTGQPYENEEKFTDAKGLTHFIATKRSLHKDPVGNLFLVGVIRDITERKRMEEELKRTAAELAQSYEELKLSEDRLRYQASHDNLTGLPNRKLFYDRLNQALEWAAYNNQIVALLFLDLDGFKSINDTQGHDTGDLLLRDVAKRLTSCLRASDTVARLGGDEFTVILPGIHRKEDAVSVAQKIMNTLAEPFTSNERPIHVTTSIGISLYPLDAKDADVLIKLADAAMYRSKESGKNKYEFS